MPVVTSYRFELGKSAGRAGGELDTDDLALCSQLGINPEDYKKTLAEEAR